MNTGTCSKLSEEEYSLIAFILLFSIQAYECIFFRNASSGLTFLWLHGTQLHIFRKQQVDEQTSIAVIGTFMVP